MKNTETGRIAIIIKELEFVNLNSFQHWVITANHFCKRGDIKND